MSKGELILSNATRKCQRNEWRCRGGAIRRGLQGVAPHQAEEGGPRPGSTQGEVCFRSSPWLPLAWHLFLSCSSPSLSFTVPFSPCATPPGVPCLSCQPNQGPTGSPAGSGAPSTRGLGGTLINSWSSCSQNLSSPKEKQRQTTRRGWGGQGRD